MIKKILSVLIVVLALLPVLSGCGCRHEWKEADCRFAKTCTLCGETEGVPTEHDWKAALCGAPKTCRICAETEGSPLGHSWDAPTTCHTLGRCTRCNMEDYPLAEHSWLPATCQAPKACSVCKLTEGVTAGHTWISATTEHPTMCTVCGWSMDDQIITDSRFHTADCQALFGYWLYEDPGKEIVLYNLGDDGTGYRIHLRNLEGQMIDNIVYYVSDSQLYMGSSWDTITESPVSWSLAEGVLTLEGLQFHAEAEYPTPNLGHEAIVFDAQACAPLFGTWSTRGFDPNAHMSIQFSDDGSMTLYAGFLVEGQKQYTYTVENGQLIFGNSQFGTKNAWAYTLADHVLTLTIADQQYTLYLSI